MTLIQERILINFPSYLIALLPAFLISGPFLSDLSILLIGIFFLINIFLKKDYDFLKNKFIILFSIFTLYLFINSLIKYYDIHSIRSSLGYLRFGIFSLGVFYFLEKRKEIINWLFTIFLICFYYLSQMDFINILIKLVSLQELEVEGSQRISSLFGTELIMGSYLSRLFSDISQISFIYLKKIKVY